MPTFMDRYPELRECIEQSELTRHMLNAWTDTTLRVYPEAQKSTTAAEADLIACADIYGLHDLEIHVFRYLIIVFTIFKNMLNDPQLSKRLLKDQTNPGSACADEIGQWLGTMTPFAEQVIWDVTSIITSAIQYGMSYDPIPMVVTPYQPIYACATFLRDFNALRTLKDPLAESTNRAWKRTAHCIEPWPLVQRFMSGEMLYEADAHTYEAILLARLSLLQHIVHPETIRLLLTNGEPKHLYQHLVAQLYPHQPGQIAHVRSWAARWQDGALLAP